VRDLLKARGESARKLAKRLGRSDRTVHAWLAGTNDPLHEHSVIAQLAVALGVTQEWLTDGRDGPPEPAVPRTTEIQELARLVPAQFRRLIFSLADRETAEWLLAQLDLYERARRRSRAARA
jgi:transcriptional regulator with XRE-family HTH domain